jgi:hypothetical protein
MKAASIFDSLRSDVISKKTKIATNKTNYVAKRYKAVPDEVLKLNCKAMQKEVDALELLHNEFVTIYNKFKVTKSELFVDLENEELYPKKGHRFFVNGKYYFETKSSGVKIQKSRIKNGIRSYYVTYTALNDIPGVKGRLNRNFKKDVNALFMMNSMEEARMASNILVLIAEKIGYLEFDTLIKTLLYHKGSIQKFHHDLKKKAIILIMNAFMKRYDNFSTDVFLNFAKSTVSLISGGTLDGRPGNPFLGENTSWTHIINKSNITDKRQTRNYISVAMYNENNQDDRNRTLAQNISGKIIVLRCCNRHYSTFIVHLLRKINIVVGIELYNEFKKEYEKENIINGGIKEKELNNRRNAAFLRVIRTIMNGDSYRDYGTYYPGMGIIEHIVRSNHIDKDYLGASYIFTTQDD